MKRFILAFSFVLLANCLCSTPFVRHPHNASISSSAASQASDMADDEFTLNFTDVASIDDWTITDAVLNEVESTSYSNLLTYVYDITAGMPSVAYVTEVPNITFTIKNNSDKSKAFSIGISQGYYGYYQAGGKNAVITIKNTRKNDIISLYVASKGSTAADFADPQGVYPINAVALSEYLTLPAKNGDSEPGDEVDNSGYIWRTLQFRSLGGDVEIKEFAAGYRIRSISIQAGEEPKVTIFGQDIPNDSTGVIDFFGDESMVYNSGDNTLTLSNLNLNVGDDDNSAAISYSGTEPLTIVLNDSSTIIADTVISSSSDIVITGHGHLVAEGVTPIFGSAKASITFEAVNMYVRSLPDVAAVRQRIRNAKRLDETGGPALSGFGSADFSKTNISPADALYGEIVVNQGSGNWSVINALYRNLEDGGQVPVTEFELKAVDDTAIRDVNNTYRQLDTTQPMFNILGMPVNADYHGVVIQNGHKFLK